MTWFKVDDKLWGHPKWLAAPPRARSLWVTAGSWSAGQGTDGRIPRHVLRTLGHSPSDAAALVAAGLWTTARDGWRFHGWDEFQPDAASEKAKHDAASDGGAWGNHVRWHVRRNIDVPSCGYCSGASVPDRVPDSGANRPGANPPDPTRPDPDTRSDSPSVVEGRDQVQIVQFRTREPRTVGLGGDD